ncbi:MAG: 16S rRNA (guanine(966)-N(2))-methyltransferase RsmD [Magnetococcales bacterium]|nr:16S rRNA (guanine(966)-N(2))-methyltransferase RsmD [Magnetococcales bacterium]MBF0262897.1 16S rRNA (guanine(966)-N(2))-methyltransferase RsmD [Magnetococcales bacterium]
MLRITGGSLRGRMLMTLPPDDRVRPTTARMRETLFSMLGTGVEGAWVLDLFAGGGTLGIEAMSRGARGALFVERDAAIVALIRKNLATCGLEARATVVREDVERAGVVASIRREAMARFEAWRGFDLIFMDPPYHAGLLAPTLAMLADSTLLAPDAVAIAEHDALAVAKGVAPAWRPMHNRRQGESQVSFWRWRGEATETGRS